MQSLAGSIVVLAGAVAVGAGAIASAIRKDVFEAFGAIALGGFLVALGIVVLLLGFVTQSKPKTRATSTEA